MKLPDIKNVSIIIRMDLQQWPQLNICSLKLCESLAMHERMNLKTSVQETQMCRPSYFPVSSKENII